MSSIVRDLQLGRARGKAGAGPEGGARKEKEGLRSSSVSVSLGGATGIYFLQRARLTMGLAKARVRRPLRRIFSWFEYLGRGERQSSRRPLFADELSVS